MQYRRKQIGKLAFLTLMTVALAALGACGPSEEIQQQLAELQAVSAEKDSLLAQVTENALLMSDISAELAKVQVPVSEAGAQEVSGPITREAILENIQNLSVRVNDSEARLAESQRRIQALTRESRNQQSRIAEFEKSIADFRSTIDNQRQTIASLMEQLDNLQQENVRLVAQNTELTETVDALAEREKTAYYVIGTKEELLERGIVTEEGGSRVLFIFGKRGKTLVPARDLDVSALNRIDLLETTQIALPEPEREYQIVSLQDLSALATPPDEDGHLVGEIQIADPARFWASNKVLIVVRT